MTDQTAAQRLAGPTQIQSRSNVSTLSLVGANVILAFAASITGFALVDGWQGGHIIAALLLTTNFAVGYLSFNARRLNSKHRTDRSQIAAVFVGAIAAGVASSIFRIILPASVDLAITPITVSVALMIVFGVTFHVGLTEVARRFSQLRPDMQRTIVVGSGGAAGSLVRLICEDFNFRYSIVGCVDDEVLSERVGGKAVLGSVDDLPRLIPKYKIGCVIIAIPSASPALVKRVIDHCVKSLGQGGRAPAVKVLPGVQELLKDGGKEHRIRLVEPEDLLPREPVKVDLAEIASHLENRVILVTGAGGSIGSELCRQIARLNPSLLLLLGHGENSLFAIDQELRSKHGFNQTKIILADVADAARIRNVFSVYRPHIVFHAAAHKHVPIVEANVCEAARNNVLGTHVVALAAAAAGVAKFVLLSTDKAVNPTSVMGATKRLAEIVSQSLVNQTGTEFVTVRFGNVLESRGSVIPTFKRQIANGGPVTITHRDMQRYFMTIPEAISLVLLAMAIGRDGQVLVLDMGRPVNILKLAETLITLSGLTPYRDIDIVETGIRPGEKLFEEILTNVEGLSKTSHSRLFIARQERVAYATLAFGLRSLESACRAGSEHAVIDTLCDFVPSYQPGLYARDVSSTNGKSAAAELQPQGGADGRLGSQSGRPAVGVTGS